MSSILTCPACQGEVALPPQPAASLGCPHCGAALQLLAQVAAPASSEIPPLQRPRPAAVAAPGLSAPAVTARQVQRVMRPSERPSALGQMAGILMGGALGMIVGYWILNYLGGPRFDFLDIPLPWVPHTQTARPAPEHSPAPPPAAAGPLMEEEEPPPRRSAGESAVPAGASSVQPPPIAPVAMPFPKYSSDDLAEALAAADAAAGCEACGSTGFVIKTVVAGTTVASGKTIETQAKQRQPCEVCGGKPTGRIDADAYQKFCRLSEVLTFIDIERSDANLAARKDAVEQVFLRAAADHEKQAALGRLSFHHLENRARTQQGVLLAGTVQELGRSGEFHWARLLLFGLPEEITVVYRTAARLKPRDRVLLAGSIIDDPIQRLPGYAGTAAQVVWGGLPVPLPDEPR